MFYLDLLQYLLDPGYRAGLVVVPIVLVTYIFQGVTFNLSFWYKLTDKTNWGAYISFIGLFITIAGNVLLVPVFGYIASAWSSFACFLVMMIISWVLGQKYYPIEYDLKMVGRYVLLTAVLYGIGLYVPIGNLYLRLAFRTVLLLLFVGYVLRKDVPAGVLPFLSKVRK
jgi:O-antigen/teichoic acid export membrane protein